MNQPLMIVHLRAAKEKWINLALIFFRVLEVAILELPEQPAL